MCPSKWRETRILESTRHIFVCFQDFQPLGFLSAGKSLWNLQNFEFLKKASLEKYSFVGYRINFVFTGNLVDLILYDLRASNTVLKNAPLLKNAHFCMLNPMHIFEIPRKSKWEPLSWKNRNVSLVSFRI